TPVQLGNNFPEVFATLRNTWRHNTSVSSRRQPSPAKPSPAKQSAILPVHGDKTPLIENMDGEKASRYISAGFQIAMQIAMVTAIGFTLYSHVVCITARSAC